MKLDGFSVILVTIVTLLSAVIMLSAFVHVSLTESEFIVEVIVTEQMKLCSSPITPSRLPLGCKEILGIGTRKIRNDTYHLVYVKFYVDITIALHNINKNIANIKTLVHD